MDRSEIRRLQKAARSNNKLALAEWASQFESQISEKLRIKYEKAYNDELQNSIDNMITSIAYTLHFSEATHLGKKRLPEFMEDLFVTIDMFRTGEYKPEDYENQLKEVGITIDTYDYSRVYKDNLEKLERVTKEYYSKLEELNKKE